MVENQYAQGITAGNLRELLKFIPQFWDEFENIRNEVTERAELFFTKQSIPFSWCHLYEFPIQKLLQFLEACLLEDENLKDIFKGLKEAPNQVTVIPKLSSIVDEYLDTLEPMSKEEVVEHLPNAAILLSLVVPLVNSLRCVLYHGCYLNELIQRVSSGDDKALFDAIRIDPTVIGCKPVIARISKASLLQEAKFFAKLKAALTGKIAKREQANFQKMRLVFEVLREADSSRLSDAQLHELFVEELKLYSGNEKGGGNTKALRKFADTYMKTNTIT